MYVCLHPIPSKFRIILHFRSTLRNFCSLRCSTFILCYILMADCINCNLKFRENSDSNVPRGRRRASLRSLSFAITSSHRHFTPMYVHMWLVYAYEQYWSALEFVNLNRKTRGNELWWGWMSPISARTSLSLSLSLYMIIIIIVLLIIIM